MNFENKYYEYWDVNSDHKFYGFIIWYEMNIIFKINNFPCAFIK